MSRLISAVGSGPQGPTQRGVAELPHFVCIELTPLSSLQSPVLDWPDRTSPQPLDPMADRIEHFPDLAIAAFVQGDLESRVGAEAIGRHHADIRRRSHAPVDRHATRQAIQIVRVGHTDDLHVVPSRHPVPRMRQAAGQVAVVGQQQQSLGVEVEPANGVDVLRDCCQQIHDRRPALRVGARRDIAAGLVEQHVPVCVTPSKSTAVDADVVVGGVGFRSELTDRYPVYGDAPFEHESLGRPPGRDARTREDFLQTFHLIQRPLSSNLPILLSCQRCES